jgi:translation initiation factor 1
VECTFSQSASRLAPPSAELRARRDNRGQVRHNRGVGDEPRFHNPFGVLGPLRGSLPQRPASTPSPPKAEASAAEKTFARAVVRLERSGRGGKEVTLVERLPLAAKDRDVWLKALKSALGCGGVVDGETLVLQGDQRRRLPALLAARGVRKVTVS